jgi:hypothetical protein
MEFLIILIFMALIYATAASYVSMLVGIAAVVIIATWLPNLIPMRRGPVLLSFIGITLLCSQITL